MGYRTPVTDAGLRQYDNLPPEEAVVRAWTRAGSHPGAHYMAQDTVEAVMPLLARAVRRLVRDRSH